MAIGGNGDVIVLGAGVSGLTSAITLAEARLDVRVIAARPPLRTTSAVAGASWGPYMITDDRVLPWAESTRLVLERLAGVERSGVSLLSGIEVDPDGAEPPDWATGLPDYRKCDSSQLPEGYLSGWSYTIPIMHMPTYLKYLTDRLAAAGVVPQVLPAPLRSLDEVEGSASVLVNCTGLGAAELVADDALYPTRGQLVLVSNPGKVRTFFQDNLESDDLTYYLPHGDQVILGGSAIAHRDDELPDLEIAANIISRCAKVEPSFAEAEIIAHLVGLRPSRSVGIRVELEQLGGRTVIHNYGHGGSGVTVSWGCAAEVLALVRAALPG
jgi:D-amino-acid oxidase